MGIRPMLGVEIVTTSAAVASLISPFTMPVRFARPSPWLMAVLILAGLTPSRQHRARRAAAFHRANGGPASPWSPIANIPLARVALALGPRA